VQPIASHGRRAIVVEQNQMDEELDALLAKCVKLLEDFQYGEAEKELNIAVSLAPNRPEVWDLLGTCYLFLNKMRDAERAYRRATELAPSIR
jgi:Flp pilus assembly protein TadD